MKKSTFTKHYAGIRKKLVELRKSAGLSQRAAADKIGRERSFISRIELGERRLDLVELFWLLRVYKADPISEVSALLKQFEKDEPISKKKKSKKRTAKKK